MSRGHPPHEHKILHEANIGTPEPLTCGLDQKSHSRKGESAAARVIDAFVGDFRQRFLRLLQGPFREQPTRLALSIVDQQGPLFSSLNPAPISPPHPRGLASVRARL